LRTLEIQLQKLKVIINDHPYAKKDQPKSRNRLDLIAIYIMMSRDKDARVEAKEVIRINLNFSVEAWAENSVEGDVVHFIQNSISNRRLS
jgi:hypothetical protein